jgi:thiamine-monophosphate kinase
MEAKRTEIGELGEFGLIDKLTSSFALQQPSSIKGVGDDAAVIDAGDRFMLLSTDALVEGIHFDLSYMPLKHLGFKAVSVNVSDIAAMNGIPTQITVSLAVSNRFSVEALEELYEGIKLACDQYKVDLVGGDTCAAHSGLMISVAVVGFVDKDKIAFRNGAKKGDIYETN